MRAIPGIRVATPLSGQVRSGNRPIFIDHLTTQALVEARTLAHHDRLSQSEAGHPDQFAPLDESDPGAIDPEQVRRAFGEACEQLLTARPESQALVDVHDR